MIADLPTHRSNLPADVSSFIGREHELEEIARLLQQHRLVTLTGPGGTGKTRLALRAAAAELDQFPDGVWLVELAPLIRPELVVETVAKVLRVPVDAEQPLAETLEAFLSRKRVLLVLDNCEHLLDECARLVANVLAQCPSLTVLATSREPMGIGGERVLRVPPLSLPAQTDLSSAERLLDYDGIRLFVERAQAAEPSFHLSDVTAASVAEICRRLDGIPLAIELAAIRVRGMGVAYLGARLDDRFRLLTNGDRTGEPRQRTLHALVDWSYSLLPERERVVLRRLCNFTGSFAAEAAETICAGEYAGEHGQLEVTPDAVFDDVLRLVDKSLVHLDQETGRYRLLETIRLFGLGRLDESGETNFISRQHFVYYLQLVEDGAALIGGPGQEAWYRRLEHEHDNFRAALNLAILAGRSDEAARMALGLWKFWRTHTYQREGLRWLEQILALDETSPLPADLRPRVFNALGVLAHAAHHFDRATAYHAEALRLWTAEGDRAGMAQAILDIGWQRFDEVDLGQAKQRASESLALAEICGDKRLIASARLLDAVARTAFTREAAEDTGDLGGVVSSLERSLVLWRELGDTNSLASTLAVLGSAYERLGEYERTKPLLAESAHLHMSAGSYGDLIGTLVGLLFLAAYTSDQPAMALDTARILGFMQAWEEATSVSPSPWRVSPPHLQIIETVTRVLGPESFAQAFAEGKSLPTAGFLALVDRITAPAVSVASPLPPASSVARAPHDDLTPREREVLRLVARGLTNAQVARELTVTPRTVNAHLTAVYGKLGVTARGGAIRYAIDHHLG